MSQNSPRNYSGFVTFDCSISVEVGLGSLSLSDFPLSFLSSSSDILSLTTFFLWAFPCHNFLFFPGWYIRRRIRKRRNWHYSTKVKRRQMSLLVMMSDSRLRKLQTEWELIQTSKPKRSKCPRPSHWCMWQEGLKEIEPWKCSRLLDNVLQWKQKKEHLTNWH